MTDQTPPQDELSEEMRKLAENINRFAKTAWESPERQKIQSELETHLNEIGGGLEDAAQQFSQSPAGQQVKNELKDFNRRLANGEIETQVKKEVVNVLGILNREIEQVANRHSSTPGPDAPPQKPV